MGKQAEQKRFIQGYILECIDSNGYDVECTTHKAKLIFLMDTFKAEYGWAIERMGEVHAFTEWLRGLPSCFNIAFTNFDILKLARAQGSLPHEATEKQEDVILEKYWRYMTMRAFELFRKLTK